MYFRIRRRSATATGSRWWRTSSAGRRRSRSLTDPAEQARARRSGAPLRRPGSRPGGGSWRSTIARRRTRRPILMVLDTDGGKEVFGLHTENESLGGFAWLDETRLAFVYVPDASEGDAPHLAVVDVGEQPLSIERLFRAKPGEDPRTPAVASERDEDRASPTAPSRGSRSSTTATWRRKVYAAPGGASGPRPRSTLRASRSRRGARAVRTSRCWRSPPARSRS